MKSDWVGVGQLLPEQMKKLAPCAHNRVVDIAGKEGFSDNCLRYVCLDCMENWETPPMTRHERSCTEASECKSCRQLILWVHWKRSGKPMPVDITAGSSKDHVVVLSHSVKENKLFAEKYEQRLHEGRRRFVSHFVTCPQASQHRRR